MQFRRVTYSIVMCSLMIVRSAHAQATAEQETRTTQGFTLDSVGVSATYFTQSIPSGITNFRDPTFLGSSEMLAGTGSVGWMRNGRGETVGIAYVPILGLRLQPTATKNWNHSLSGFLTKRPRRSKWAFNAAGNAHVMSFDEALFSDNQYLRFVSSGATAGEVASAVLQGNSVQPALASAQGFETDTTAEHFFFGRRTAYVGGRVGMTWTPFRRLAAEWVVGGTRVEHISDPGDLLAVQYPGFTAQSGGLDLRYSLSRRMQIAYGANIIRTQSTLIGEVTSYNMKVAFNRTMRRWFFETTAGRGSSSSVSGQQVLTYSGGIGVVLFKQALMASYARDISDSYIIALGSGSVIRTTMTAAWNWSPRRSSLIASANFSYVLDDPPDQLTTKSWQTLETVGRRIGRGYSVTVQYSGGEIGSRRYIQNGRQYQLRQKAIRVSVNWSPRSRRREDAVGGNPSN